jgi:type IV pilus assembly protein PilC
VAKYSFKALDASGKKIEGSIEAKDRDSLKQKIRGMKLHLISARMAVDAKDSDVSAAETPVFGTALMKWIYRDSNGDVQLSIGNNSPTNKDLIIFTKQFATMLQSGVTLNNSLKLLAGQQQNREFKKTIYFLRNAIESGAKLSDAMEQRPAIFDVLYCSMIRAGEASGGLDRILIQLCGYIERSAKIKTQIKKAMTYPTLVIIVAFGVIAGLLTFVVPAMASNFKDSGKELPALTAAVMGMSDQVINNWVTIVLFLVALGIGFKVWKSTEKGRYQFDVLSLKFPVIGNVIKKIAVGRFCNTMASMLGSGVNLLEALTICASSSGNLSLEKFILSVRESIEKGGKFSEPLRKGKIFPEMVVSMIMVGEETGKIDDMLAKIAVFYEEEVELAVGAMLSLIEPILLVGIGGIVAVILLAMYLPMFEMAGNV